ncbi:MAG: oxidoreductase [Bacteroidetes bacterium]|nr:oxidoreductase [Bacteroidota bacterium]
MENQYKTAVIAGATGLVGKQLLNQLLASPLYGKVIAVVRKPMELVQTKLEQHVVDFDKLPEALRNLKADHGYCALGTTIKVAGSKEKQYIIDHDYVVAFAKGCMTAGVDRFAVVSSIGANAKSSNFYLRTKGETEQDLGKLPFKGLFILQPSFLLGDRKESRPGEKAGIVIMNVLGPLMIGGLRKYRGVQADAVARCMIVHALSEEKGERIIQSDEIG